jgi:alpha-glucoside transport system substrate-binding protein
MKKYRWLWLAVVMAFVIAACGGGDATTTTAGEETATTEGGASTTAAEEGATTTAGAPAESTGYDTLDEAMSGAFEGTTVEIVAQWVEGEEENFNAALDPFREATGIDVQYEGLPDYELALQTRVDGGDAPDLAQIAQPGKMASYQADGQLVDISGWFNVDKLREEQVAGFVELTEVDGGVYGVYYKTDVKSIVWYPVAPFEEAGYAIPTTWDEMTALSDQIIADGNGNPWCVGIESEAADGWVATDWLEDIVLRTAGVDFYNQWWKHEVPFNSPEVLAAAEQMSAIWFAPDYVYGGNTAINATNIRDVANPMFDPAGPQCWFQKQASWIPEFWPGNRDVPDREAWANPPGEASSFFYLPGIDPAVGNPVLGAGDMFSMFTDGDRPEVRALLEYLATPQGAQAWIEVGGFISPNTTVPPDWYTTYPNTELVPILTGADAFGFDASDLMPAEVGAGSFWTGMVDWVAANGEGTEEIFQSIEDSWPTG